MELRIYRTFSWEVAQSRTEIKYGGDNCSLKLVAHDELQYWEEGKWIPVEVVEAEKPVNPNNIITEIDKYNIAKIKEVGDIIDMAIKKSRREKDEKDDEV